MQRIHPLIGILTAALFTIPAQADDSKSTRHLPAKSAEQIQKDMANMLRQLGDLAQYIEGVGDDGTVSLRVYSNKPACVPTIPKTTLAAHPVDKDQLGTVEAALNELNRSLEAHEPLKVRVVFIACMGANKP